MRRSRCRDRIQAAGGAPVFGGAERGILTAGEGGSGGVDAVGAAVVGGDEFERGDGSEEGE